MGGSTGDLWTDLDELDVPPSLPQQEPQREAPGAAPRTPSARARQPRPAERTAFMTSRSPAFARLQELFPGHVLEVRPLREQPEETEPEAGTAATVPDLGAGYDVAEEPEASGDEA